MEDIKLEIREGMPGHGDREEIERLRAENERLQKTLDGVSIYSDSANAFIVRQSAENKRLREALEAIDSTPVPEIEEGSGDVDMTHEAKKYCAAFGACICIAREALARAGG